jgi:hypothetical protein
MIGRVEEADLEAYLRERRCVVLDGVAPGSYKPDPRVIVVHGGPIGNQTMPGIVEGLGAELPGQSVPTMDDDDDGSLGGPAAPEALPLSGRYAAGGGPSWA